MSQVLVELRNLGPVTSAWLQAVGIHNRDDLAKIGSIGAYRILQGHGYRITLVGLYAMEGALRDMPWNRLPDKVRNRLKSAVGKA